MPNPPALKDRPSRKARRQRRTSGAQIQRLMTVAEAARLTMGAADDMPLVPRLLLEDHSNAQTAEDAWRSDARGKAASKAATIAKSAPAHGGWLPWGFAQLVGGRAMA